MDTESPMYTHYDIGIIGSGFSGSLLAWILSKRGFSVVIIDRAQHPRFAIGESSTPLADFLLEHIADHFGLPELKSLSRWGTWQRDLPQLRAGKKRGFSYYSHARGEHFRESQSHENSLLVAASSTDELSDTHWMRSDVDEWLCKKAVQAGATLFDNFAITSVQRINQFWEIRGEFAETIVGVQCGQLIDASGSGHAIGQALGLEQFDNRLRTQTGAMYGHFRNVGSMSQWLANRDLLTSDDPFCGDDAAQHHWIGEGWFWMLRFADGTTSVGLVQPTANWSDELINATDRLGAWRKFLTDYPTVCELMENAELVAPHDTQGMPKLAWLPRINRLWERAAGDSWLMIPTTAGFVDPLHSTGIAHSLSGVMRAADILTRDQSHTRRCEALEQYSLDVVAEVRWIDQLVSACYTAAKHSFEAFVAASSLYFISAVHCERQMATSGDMRDGFLLARSATWQHIVHETLLKLEDYESGTSDSDLTRWLRGQIKPWNDFGLLEPLAHRRISRSVAPAH